MMRRVRSSNNSLVHAADREPRDTYFSVKEAIRHPRIVRKIAGLLRNSPCNSAAIFSTKRSADCNALSRHSVCLVLTSRRDASSLISIHSVVRHVSRMKEDISGMRRRETDTKIRQQVNLYFCDQNRFTIT